MSIHILASNNSVRNTTLSCDSMGIHYEVTKSKQTGVVSVHRWESTTNENTLVGEIEFHLFAADMLRLGGNAQWERRKDILSNEGNNPLARTRTFTGNNGIRYKWKFHWDSLRLHHADADAVNTEPLVIYHRHFMSNPSYLEIHDTSVLSGLDSIIVTFLYMEKKRRDREKTRRRNAAGGGGP